MFYRQRAAENATLSYFFGCIGIGRSVVVDVVAGDEDLVPRRGHEAGRADLVRDRHPCAR